MLTNAHTVNAKYLPNGKAYAKSNLVRYTDTSKTLLLAYYSTTKLSLETKMAGRQNNTGQDKFL